MLWWSDLTQRMLVHTSLQPSKLVALLRFRNLPLHDMRKQQAKPHGQSCRKSPQSMQGKLFVDKEAVISDVSRMSSCPLKGRMFGALIDVSYDRNFPRGTD